MLKVMIVDDELLVRVGIQSTIAWEENGFQIVCNASNGEEALCMYMEKTPDIIITDIKMPKMDGIELAKRIRETNKTVGIIMLTCYSEVNYLMDSIKFGVNDYLIKATMEPHDLLQSVLKVGKHIEESMRGLQDMEKLRIELEAQRPVVQQKVMIDFIKGNLNCEENVADTLKEHGIIFTYPHFELLYFKIDDYKLQYGNYSKEEKQILKKSVINTVLQFTKESRDCKVFEIEENDFLYIVSLNISQVKAMEFGKGLAEKIRTAVIKYTAATISIAISRYVNAVEDIPSVFSETKGFMEYKVFFGKSCIITFSQIQRLEYQNYELNFKGENEKLQSVLKEGDSEKVRISLEDIFAKISISKNSLAILDYTCLQLVSLLNGLCQEFKYKRPEDLGILHFAINQVYLFETIEDIKKWFMEQFDALCFHMKLVKYPSSNFVIRKAIEYINKNSSKAISLGEVAEYANISRTYFCQIFKQEMGENFVDYLNKVRIAKAKELLHTTDLKNYEIAEKIGFQENTYFCRIFKQLEDVTPAEYRKRRV